MDESEQKILVSLDYTRRLYSDVFDWYKNADSKAQVILTLDGLFLTYVASTIIQNAENFSDFPWYSLSLLSLMFISLFISIISAILCIWSRIYSPAFLMDFLSRAKIDRSNYETYKPSVCWFFQFISSLDNDEFKKRMHDVDATFEIDVLASQIYLLSANVTKKHQFVNYSFIFAGITLSLLLASGVSLII